MMLFAVAALSKGLYSVNPAVLIGECEATSGFVSLSKKPYSHALLQPNCNGYIYLTVLTPKEAHWLADVLFFEKLVSHQGYILDGYS